MKLLMLADFSIEELPDQEFRVEAEVYDRVINAGLEATNDSAFGLHIGEHLSLSAAGLIYQIVQTSSTVEEALSSILRK